jgi:hypothetical protein
MEFGIPRPIAITPVDSSNRLHSVRYNRTKWCVVCPVFSQSPL